MKKIILLSLVVVSSITLFSFKSTDKVINEAYILKNYKINYENLNYLVDNTKGVDLAAIPSASLLKAAGKYAVAYAKVVWTSSCKEVAACFLSACPGITLQEEDLKDMEEMELISKL